MPGTPEIRIEADPAQLGRILRAAKAFEGDLAKATRRRLREAGNEGVRDVRRRVMGRTFHVDDGLAASIAAATKLSIRTGARTAGISIRTTGSKGGIRLARAYNKPTFRHEVFGHADRLVVQRGRPYFGAVLKHRHGQMLEAMNAALNDAVKAMERA